MISLTMAMLGAIIAAACILGGVVSVFTYKHTKPASKKVSDVITMARTREKLRVAIDSELDKMTGISGWFKKKRIHRTLSKENLL